MELNKIIENDYTGGFSMYFKKGENFFYADQSPVPYIGIETMIFACDENGEVTSWADLYCDRSGKSLAACVNEFKRQTSDN
jgi:hypothetical protein